MANIEGDDKIVTTYIAKPMETLCQENVSFLLKHLDEMVYQSGISTLYNGEQMHDSHYKHLQMSVEKTYEGENTFLELKFKVAYVTQLTNAEK